MSKIDVTAIKQTVDLLELIGRDVKQLKLVASTGGGEYAGPCPFCSDGGKDRLRVQPAQGRWWCRQCGDRWQDAIGYVMRREGCGFKDACALLDGRTLSPLPDRERPPAPPAKPVTIEDVSTWRAAGEQLVAEAEAALWSPDGEPARRYLNRARGLADETIRAFRLGLQKSERFDEPPSWGLPDELNPATGHRRKVWLPRGVVVPCFIGGVLVNVKIRRRDQDLKGGYNSKMVFVRGGHPALFNADALTGADVIMLVEGEFDCMLAHQAAAGRLAVGTLGNAQARLDVRRWWHQLIGARCVLVAYDVDAAGRKGSEEMAKLSARMRRVRVPVLCAGDKDITDYWRAGGDVSGWIGAIAGRPKPAAQYATAIHDVQAAPAAPAAPAASRGLTVAEFMAASTDEALRVLVDLGAQRGRGNLDFYQAAARELTAREAHRAATQAHKKPLF